LFLATPPPPLDATVSTYQRKVFAFADDANMLVKFDYYNLSLIKKILTDFGVLSGLECSVEKTTILPIGIPTPIDNRILDLGFSIAEEVTILGLTIGKGSGTLNKNFSNIRNRIRNQINNWSRFQLSLPGRIVVTKTMLYSQINYLGCFIEIPNERLKEMDNLITGFVK
jgi:hypothetical protein